LKRHDPTLFDAPAAFAGGLLWDENGPQTLPGRESVNAIGLTVKALPMLMVSRR
jgi:hypothetical protein